MVLWSGGTWASGPSVWVKWAVDAPPAVRAEIGDLYGRAVIAGLAPSTQPPSITPVAPASAAEVAALLRDGEDAFFAIELDKARSALSAAWERLRKNPALLADPAVGPARAASGLLTLVRAHLHEGRGADAEAVLRWLLGVHPDAEISAATQPANVVELARTVRSSLVTGRITWEVLGPSAGCRVFLHGMDRGAQSPVEVAAGEHLLWVRCGDAAGWSWRVDVPAGGQVTLRTAPATEATLRWENGALVPSGELEAGAPLVIARALGVSVVAPLGEAGAMSLIEARPDGTTRVVVVPPSEAPAIVESVEAEASGALSGWGWATLGLGAALVAGGGALHGVHDGRVGSGGATSSNMDDARTLRGASIGLYAAGGAALATGIVLLIVDAADAPVAVGAGPGGVALLGRF